MSRTPLLVGGWLVSAAAALALVTVALDHVGGSTSGDELQPLSASDINAALAAERSRASQAPTTTPAADTATGSEPVAKQFTGGSVVATCHDGLAYLVSWSPAIGYEVDGLRRGPAEEATVVFDPEDRQEDMVTARCTDGKPEITHHLVPED